MGKLVRCISSDGMVAAMALDSTDIVGRMEQIHKTSAVVSAGLGRLLTAASLMGVQLKGRGNSVTLRMKGGGPAGTLIAVSDSQGNVRGCVDAPVVELPLNGQGKLDVAGAVGTDGFLTVVKDLGMKEPYVGQIPIISGEIAEDITQYYALSEQVPTVCALGVLVGPDLTICAAGGLLIQLLPAADEAVVGAVERCAAQMPPVTAMLEEGLSPEEICRRALPEFTLEVLDESQTAYRCDCSRDRFARALISLGREELAEMEAEGQAEIICHFCDQTYVFSAQQLHKMMQSAKSKKT